MTFEELHEVSRGSPLWQFKDQFNRFFLKSKKLFVVVLALISPDFNSIMKVGVNKRVINQFKCAGIEELGKPIQYSCRFSNLTSHIIDMLISGNKK